MPRGDRTGPVGCGPMTGRGAGYCAGYGVPGYANPMGRGRFGRGGFGGRGWRHRHYAAGMPGWARFQDMPPAFAPYPPAGAAPVHEPVDDAAMLREQADYLREALADIEKRLSELESASGE
jgi:hypothetical protein